jgi:hypothetical protein
MFDFLNAWQKKSRPMPERVLEHLARQTGVAIDELRSHPACHNLDSMTSLDLVELVATVMDKKPPSLE